MCSFFVHSSEMYQLPVELVQLLAHALVLFLWQLHLHWHLVRPKDCSSCCMISMFAHLFVCKLAGKGHLHPSLRLFGVYIDLSGVLAC